MAGIKAVFFDLDETLIGTEASTGAAYERIKKMLCIESETDDVSAKSSPKGYICIQDVIELYKQGLKSTPNDAYKVQTPRSIRSKLWEDALLQSLQSDNASCLGPTLAPSSDVSILAAELYENWNTTRLKKLKMLEPVTIEILSVLRMKYILILITNGSSVVQWEKIKHIDMENFFDHIIVSGDEEHDKPHVSIFQKACSLCNLQPEQCVMIGDSADTDILGANMSGLAASILFTPDGKISSTSRSGNAKQEQSRTPTYTISSIAQLPTLLKSL